MNIWDWCVGYTPWKFGFYHPKLYHLFHDPNFEDNVSWADTHQLALERILRLQIGFGVLPQFGNYVMRVFLPTSPPPSPPAAPYSCREFRFFVKKKKLQSIVNSKKNNEWKSDVFRVFVI